MPQEPLPSATRVSDALREILADPDFATFDGSPRHRLIAWVGRTLREIWNWLQRLVGEDGAGIVAIVVVIVALAALLIMARVASRHAPRMLGRERDDDEGPASTPATAGDWLRVASRRAGAGAFRPAATALYQGFLLSLEQQGVLSFHDSKTPGDYSLEIARAGGGEGTTGGRRFLTSFQDYSFGQDEPTLAGYADLARMARDAGCPVDEEGAER